MIPASTPFPSELTLDRYLLGEASGEEVREVTKWIAVDPNAAAELARRKREAAAAFGPVPDFMALSEKVAARRQTDTLVKSRFPVYRMAFTGVALLTFIVTVLQIVRPGDEWTAKGDTSYCIVKHDSTITTVHDSVPCTTGDTVQVFHRADDIPWVMLLYTEPDGTTLPCVPSDTALLMVSSSVPVPLPFSMVIDTTKGILELALVASAHPFSATDATKALQGRGHRRMHITRYRLLRE